MTPFCVDANAIHEFQRERITERPALGHAAIEAIRTVGCIALDIEQLCLQEWIDTAGGSFPFALKDWIANELITGRIRYYPLADNSCRAILNQFGLPQKDHKWIRLALGCKGRVLVTGDIDFFDPTMKSADAKQKSKIRAARSGPCAKGLKKKLGIEIMCLEHVPAFA
jgi:hypothetical protein